MKIVMDLQSEEFSKETNLFELSDLVEVELEIIDESEPNEGRFTINLYEGFSFKIGDLKNAIAKYEAICNTDK